MANSKDVVVTGVSTGIGWATTKVLASKGFRVFGSIRKQADADHLQKEFSGSFVPLIMDITDADAVRQAAQKVGSMIGGRNLAGLVNNAGIVVSGPLLYLRPSEYRRQLEVNMISPLIVIQAFAPLLGKDKKRQGPADRIVNISSTTAKVVLPNFQKFIVTEARTNGLSPDRLGEAVHVALTAAKPKARYAVVPQRFKNWTLPRLLPARALDAQLAKLLGIIKL